MRALQRHCSVYPLGHHMGLPSSLIPVEEGLRIGNAVQLDVHQ